MTTSGEPCKVEVSQTSAIDAEEKKMREEGDGLDAEIAKLQGKAVEWQMRWLLNQAWFPCAAGEVYKTPDPELQAEIQKYFYLMPWDIAGETKIGIRRDIHALVEHLIAIGKERLSLNPSLKPLKDKALYAEFGTIVDQYQFFLLSKPESFKGKSEEWKYFRHDVINTSLCFIVKFQYP